MKWISNIYSATYRLQFMIHRESLEWAKLKGSDFLRSDTSRALCCDSEILKIITEMKEWRCWFPECERKLLANATDWIRHLRGTHGKSPCEICFAEDIKLLFPPEHRLYKIQELESHRKLGDYGCPPHVKCPVCHIWLLDQIMVRRV